MSCLKLLSARKMHSSSRNPLISGNSSLEHSKICILSNPIFTEFVQCSIAKAWHTCENLCIYYLLIPSPIATAECGLEMNWGHLAWQCNLAKTDTTFVWSPYMLFVYSLSLPISMRSSLVASWLCMRCSHNAWKNTQILSFCGIHNTF